MTLEKLIKRYRKDKVSSFQKLRHASRVNYVSILDRIVKHHGRTKLKTIKARTLLSWHAAWSSDGRTASGQDFVKRLRTVFRFGAAMLEDPEAARIAAIFSMLRFKGAAPRCEALTAEQAEAVRIGAHAVGLPSIALAQAFQFELMLRQKDVIGEWMPLKEPCASDVVHRRQKWARGLRWDEIDADLILRHTTSKKLKDIEVDLKLAPMVMEELARFDRLPRSGPVVIFEGNGRPWGSSWFRRKWRDIADGAGVPKTVRNMDSRAGGITEATGAGADIDEVRQTATHSDIAMTQRYNRGNYRQRSAHVMRRRVASRRKAA
jgi:predicted metal-binding protein